MGRGKEVRKGEKRESGNNRKREKVNGMRGKVWENEWDERERGENK